MANDNGNGANGNGMDLGRERKLELIRRSLGLRHKIKVHESMKSPETHEEIAVSLLGRWELEDELKAIEKILDESRNDSVEDKRKIIEQNILSNRAVKAKPVLSDVHEGLPSEADESEQAGAPKKKARGKSGRPDRESLIEK